MNKVAFLLAALATGFVVSCSYPIKSDPINKSEIKILILGNSITHHGPSPELGWNGDWGMAASAREKDYVHLLIDTLRKSKPKMCIDYRESGIAVWEWDFNHDFCKDEYLNYKPDILIIRLGENVEEKYGRANDYGTALSRLITTFKADESRVIITGNFWPSEYNDRVQKRVASDLGYPFVELSDLAADDSNTALGQFRDEGVANHPSDKGMFNISDRLYKCIFREGWLD